MSLSNLENKIKNGKVNGVYLFFGEENYEVNRLLEKTRKTFSNLEIGVNYFNIDNSNILTLRDVIESISFFGEEKLIVIKDTGLKFDMTVFDDMNKKDIAVIIIEKSVDKRISEYKYLAKNASCIEFKELNIKDAALYIIKTLRAYKIEVSKDVADYMVVSCTTNKNILINEFKKIVAYLEDKNKVLTKEIIDKICSKTLNAKTFGVLELAINKQKEKAIKGVEDLLEQKESAIGISIMLFKQIKNMYTIRSILEKDREQGTRTNIIALTGMHPYQFQKLEEASRRYTAKELEKLIKEFDEYDERTKLGEMDFNNGIIRLVMGL